jgi:L,D-peptidoglycan transpeptidase YkuD (ErfK/YbiS/YcfS/YnhG family)
MPRAAVAVSLALGLCAAGASAGAPDTGAACASTLAGRVAVPPSTTQLITVVVRASRSTHGVAQRWQRVTGACWKRLATPSWAWVGERGVSAHKREGDRTTPAGVFPFERTMYGLAPNPGVRYRYHRIVCGDWWVEDPRSPWYNRFRHVPCGTPPPFRVTSEDMSRSPTAYRHLAVIAYNTAPVVRGRGSGIFLHASTGRPTLGCVSLPLARLVETLRWLRPRASPRIAIATQAQLTRPAA